MPGAGGREKWGVTTNAYAISVGDDKKCSKLDSGDGCKLYKYIKTQWIVYLKRVNFMVCGLYLNKKGGPIIQDFLMAHQMLAFEDSCVAKLPGAFLYTKHSN